MSEKILIIGPSWVGDMIMAQALFKALKHLFSDVQIDVLAPAWSCALTERMPEVSQRFASPFRHGELALRKRYKLAKQLQENHYQSAFVLPNSFKSALIPWWANIPRRIGWVGEWRYPLLTHAHKLNKKRYPLMVEQYVALAYPHQFPLPFFRPRLEVKEKNSKTAQIKYGLQAESAPVLILCPGAEFGASKRWPATYYGEIACHYLKAGYQIWILGSAKDKEVAQIIQEKTQQQSCDLTGQTSLAEAVDLMACAKAVLTNDSGLMHIAASLDKPLVALYGSTDPTFTPPLHPKAKVLQEHLPCQPCFKRQCPLQHHACMKNLGVEQVKTALDEIMI